MMKFLYYDSSKQVSLDYRLEMNEIENESVTSSISLRLTPAGSLQFDCAEDTLPRELKPIYDAFQKDWLEGWFQCAADKIPLSQYHSLHFWQTVAARQLNSLCHLPPGAEFSVESISPQWLEDCISQAPPMPGAEYLSPDRLACLWKALSSWIEKQVQACGGLQSFLTSKAPQWKQVGRVCFHLAEIKNDDHRPFAFLATYSTGFGNSGKLKHLPLREALQQYSGTNNKQALINLLSPVSTASEKCEWLQDILTTGELYQPLAWTPPQAYQLLSSIPQLEESGLTIRVPNWWKGRSRPQVKVTIGSSLNKGIELASLLDFDMQIAVGDQKISEEELLAWLSESNSEGLVQLKGQWVEIDRKKLKEALQHWKHVQKQCKNGHLSYFEGMRLLAGAPSDFDNPMDSPSERSWVQVVSGDALTQVLRCLRDPALIKTQNIEGLNATLRTYQEQGVEWLSLLAGLGLGACLADDMGLGKTIQVLALLLRNMQIKRSEQPSLLVVPASLLSNWEAEAKRFTPGIRLLLLHPSRLSPLPSKIEENIDLVITTYSMINRLKWLNTISWNLLILDEAQAIKNPGTQQAKAIKQLKSLSRIAMTGTPIENRLSDLWSLFDFLNPGLLGSSKRFAEYIQFLNQKPGQFESLRKLVGPYILRRMKTDAKIISDLPEKIETNAYCCLTKQQIQHYQRVVNELKKSLESIDPQRRRGLVLQTLLNLKQICNHPCHFIGHGDYTPADSGKFQRLGQICEELASRQEKVLIFTQFSEIIVHLEEFLAGVFGKRGQILHGGTPIAQRKHLVDNFQNENGPPFFVLSLKAGGTGLTLTAASHVIHFDRWWNPAVENQATDRAFRIGQKKNVQVHKFVTQGTVEEQIDEIIASKRKLAQEVLAAEDEIKITELPDKELLNLLTLNIDKAMEH